MTTMNTTKTGADFSDTIDVDRHPLFGPFDRMPNHYRGPHRLGHHGWLNLASRLERREEIASVRSAMAANQRVLDVGGGTGELTRAVAAEVGHCTTVEPHRQRVATLRGAAESAAIDTTTIGTAADTAAIRAVPGRAEELPFADGSFDAVMAAWVLPYVDDLELAIREMARVCDPSRPEAKIVLIGGAPDNELVSLLNETCVPLAGEPHDHQGFLLATAARVLAGLGYSRLTLWRTEAALHFPEPSLERRVATAAAVLGDFWYEGHPRIADMRAALTPVLRRHFRYRPHAVGDQGVVLVARPAHVFPS